MKYTITISGYDSTVLSQIQLEDVGILPNVIELAIEDSLVNLKLCSCNNCEKWYPESELSEDFTGLYCPECFQQLS